MTTDPKQIVAEMRAAELLCCLQAAVDGAPHWRVTAKKLLWEIDLLHLPPMTINYLRELDARKRVAEIMQDVVRDCSEREGVQ